MTAGSHFYRELELKLYFGMVEWLPAGVFSAVDTEEKLSEKNTRARQ